MVKITCGKVGLVALGFLAGTVGVKLLSSREAKKAYAHITAASIRAKDCVVKRATIIQENCGDILADAKKINAEIAAKQEAEAKAVEDATE